MAISEKKMVKYIHCFQTTFNQNFSLMILILNFFIAFIDLLKADFAFECSFERFCGDLSDGAV